MPTGRPFTPLERLLRDPAREQRSTHVERVAARQAVVADWPSWAHPQLVRALHRVGVTRPWAHQVTAADAAWAGRSVVMATGTASGKSLGYLLPVLTTLLEGAAHPSGRGATALYLSPTKALAADQLAAVRRLRLADLRAGTYDGDTAPDDRAWVREHAALAFTNPDMLHRGMLPGHEPWSSFLRRLRFVVVDECHAYRGVFGSHVAQVLRRLRRVCLRYGAEPVFLLASATTADPARTAARLTGLAVEAVTDDASPHGASDVVLWEPPLTDIAGENGAPVRRSATAETAELMADLVVEQVTTLAFIRSRRGAEAVAMNARRLLTEVDGDLGDRVAAYRAGYLPEERRSLEADLRAGRLLALASTSALELGIDVSGLDAVLIAGWPGTRASLWQQAGRAGRAGQHALAVLVARDDPLDTYLVHHPEALFGRPVEETVLDPDNPYVLGPHLCAAAQEMPLREGADLATFGPAADGVLAGLTERGLLRRRPSGWFWTHRERAVDTVDLRGAGGPPVRIVESGTGRLLGTVDAAAAHGAVHPGAVYLHQGESYLVDSLDLTDSVAFVDRTDLDHTTSAREVTEITVAAVERQRDTPPASLALGVVEVTHQVVAYLKRRLVTGEILGEEPLDLPPRQLRTRAVWWTLDDAALEAAGLTPAVLPGAAHAAEHAAIGLLPLFATCDRWDIGGVSTARHADTGLLTVFVYDGHPGGAGFAERGFDAAHDWLRATRAGIAACECAQGCPSCVQSPKCGNGNVPLDKIAAVRLLDVLLDAFDRTSERPG